MLRFLGATFLSFFLFGQVSPSQAISTATVASDPQAIALSSASITALTGGTAINDVTLSGHATETAGSTTTSGTATFKAKGFSESRLDLQGSGFTEIRSLDSNGNPQGVWMTSGAAHKESLHNVLTDSSWFFPALSSLNTSARPDVVAIYVGQEPRNGSNAHHLHLTKQVAVNSAAPANLMTNLTASDLFIDSASLLPIAVEFQTHADDDALTNIPVEVQFSSYQNVNGFQVPFHVQKFFNGSLILDFQASTAVINSGLSDSDFAISK